MTKEIYIRCEATFKGKTRDAVKVDFSNGDTKWIPRSVMSWQCEKEIDNHSYNQTFELIIAEWFADKTDIPY